MPDSRTTGILFTGTDGLTCHEFIRTIRQHAIEAGKSRDEPWMADYASISLGGEALRWFEDLDPETQVDWTLLRRAMISRFSNPEDCMPRSLPHTENVPVFTFTGVSKDECQSFVKSIRTRASTEGKEGDLAWLAKLAYPCFSGKALDWHASLPDNVQQDWNQLERAILFDYPRHLSLAISPVCVHVDDWYNQLRASSPLREIQTQDDWLAQARERRRVYIETQDKSMPCWLLVETESQIPDNAVATGVTEKGEPLFSARAWQGHLGIVVGKCHRQLPGAHLPSHGKEVANIRPFEVLVGDPSFFQWVAIPPDLKTGRSIVHRPFRAVEAGIDKPSASRATFIYQNFHQGGWHPGKVHSSCSAGYFSYNGREMEQKSVRVLAWAD